MAILGKYNASISTAEGSLLEWDDPDFEPDPSEKIKVVRFIKAKAGANFTVNFKLEPGFKFRGHNSMSIDIYLDGKCMSRPVLMANYRRDKNGGHSGRRNGVVEGQPSAWTKRKFMFGNLKLSEEDPHDRSENVVSKYANIGEIKVEFWRSDGGRSKKANAKILRDDLLPEQIPEKALKGRAVDLGVRLGQARIVASPSYRDTAPIDKHPAATFVFKYRSEEALKIMGIIERTPSPAPLEERPVEDLTPEELREVVRRQKADIKAAQAKIKMKKEDDEFRGGRLRGLNRELLDDDDDEDVSIVQAPRKKQRRTEPAEVIDLTID